MQNILSSLKVYKNPKILAILFLGFASGLPLPLTGATLDAVLNQSGVTKTAIGLFALISIPYSLKFLWSPIIDRLSIPIFTKLIGRRRSWMILTQISLIASITMLGFSNPAENLMITAMLALWVAFSSASQDIVIDAYRIETLDASEQGAGASVATTGYIISMKLIGGAMAFWLSDLMPWSYVYAIMGAIMIFGIIAIIIAGEPAVKDSDSTQSRSFSDFFYNGVLAPFIDFIKTPGWWMIIAFIIFYKFGDAFAGKMTTPFLQDIGFTNTQLAFYLKTFGLVATLLGTFLGGMLVYKIGSFKSLFICGLLQMFSNLMFVLLAHLGDNTTALAATIAVENLSGGMGTAAFVAYLSGLCNIRYTATQYALLSSLSATGRTFLSSSSGWFAQTLGWSNFFVLSTVIAIPGIMILLLLMRIEKIKLVNKA
jgi:MFS transporter, PAT family, beta-lactamase induction signal transducer AmpG